MSGVEILNQTTVYETDMHWWILILCASIGLLIGLAISIYNWVQYGFEASFILLTVAVTVVGAWIGFLFVFLTEHKTDTVDYIEYKVTISDEVNFNNFSDKYEILDQEGKIYTVKERENNQC